MTLVEKVKESIVKAFDENNRQIVEFDNVYAAAKRFMDEFGEAKMAEYAENVPNILGAIKKTAESERKKVENQLREKRLEVEMVLSSHNGGEIYVPARYAKKTAIEKDLVGHVSSAVCLANPNAKIRIGRFGKYVAVSGDIRINAGILKRLIVKEKPEAMRLANVDLVVYEMSLPFEAAYQGELRSIKIGMTPSAVRYKLIPVHKENSRFFPSYKIPFEIVTLHGVMSTQVTSKTPAPGRGSYICSTGDGSLGKIIKAMRLRAGSQVQITEITPKKKYSMKKV